MKERRLIFDREIIVMVLSCLIIVGACFGYIGYKALKERNNDKKFAESIESWFETEAKNKFDLLLNFECDESRSDCTNLKLKVKDNFNSFSVVEKYDYITEIDREFKSKRVQFLVDSKKIENTMSALDRVHNPSIVLATSTNEFEYHGTLGNLTEVNGKEYTWNEISELRKEDNSKKESDENNESKFTSQKNKKYNAEDYNYEGEYKPVDQMTHEEKREELIEMLERAISQ
ncbi:hypothetical protein PAEAM_45180 [Paenibacillus sp. GM1FR]|uniref:hypothetical protein n=1 Tax=Paenibacillus sp. GM1FR TaxID=2059267 RepID=UPI000C277F72|nr:hypothetical protein [Paenibacillus sp. GM1FR]PJN52538.1 hypothetical protein PAEAM_45180 [Paenibacillus sp. GM1FR]